MSETAAEEAREEAAEEAVEEAAERSDDPTQRIIDALGAGFEGLNARIDALAAPAQPAVVAEEDMTPVGRPWTHRGFRR